MIPLNLMKAIDRIQYRDWKLHPVDGNERVSFFIEFSFSTIDTDHIHDIPISITFTINYPFIVDEEQMFGVSEAQWILLIRSAIRSITLHEMDEFILVDGKQAFRPHAPDGTAIFETPSFQ